MRYFSLFILLFTLNAKADMLAFKCDYGKNGEVIGAEEIQPGQKTLTETYHWEENFAVKVTIFDLTKKNSSGIVVEVKDGKLREFEAECFLVIN